MLKKVIKYIDYNGVEREEEFYFNLTKGELVDMEFSKTGGFESYIRKIAITRNTTELMQFFKGLLKASYGIKSDDGRRFMKSEEIWKDFEECPAYSELLTELLLSPDAESAIEFITKIMPGDLDLDDVDVSQLPSIPGLDNKALLEQINKNKPVEKPGPPR